MDDLRTNVDGRRDEVLSLKRRIRLLLVIVLILIILSLSLGYCSYTCMNEKDCPVEAPTETSRPIITLPPETTMTPDETTDLTATAIYSTTLTVTPDLDATATAACSGFMDEFPGTPCP